jgi:methylenetetrahydrofolate reductase (NADPH)
LDPDRCGRRKYGTNLKTFKEAVRTHDFTVTAKIPLTPATNADVIREHAEILRDKVCAILLTDNQFGKVHMSTLAASAILLQNDIDPIMQLSCLNKNRMALISDLLGAAALGITSVYLVRGHKLPDDYNPRPKTVNEIGATELIATAMKIKSDPEIEVAPDFFIGGTVTPHKPKPDQVPTKLIEKIESGAQFVQTHVCMNMELLRNYMKHLVAHDLIRRVSFFGGTAIFPSAEAARWLRENRRNAFIPESIIKRLKQAADPEQEGVKICIEQLQEMAEIPGVAGANIMSGGNIAAIAEAIRVADIN